MSGHDLNRLFITQGEVRRWSAERDNATARLELARSREAAAFLLSQYEPVHSLGMDREALRALLSFVGHGDKSRLTRELALLNGGTS